MDDSEKLRSAEDLVFAMQKKNEALERVIDDYRKIIDILKSEVYKQKNRLQMKRILKFFGLVSYKEYKETMQVLIDTNVNSLGMYIAALLRIDELEEENEKPKALKKDAKVAVKKEKKD